MDSSIENSLKHKCNCRRKSYVDHYYHNQSWHSLDQNHKGVIGGCDGVGVSSRNTSMYIIDTIRERENEVENKSKITDRGGKVHIVKSKLKGVRINL